MSLPFRSAEPAAVVLLECSAEAASDCVRAVGASAWVLAREGGSAVLLDGRDHANATAGVATSLDKTARAVVVWRSLHAASAGISLVRRARQAGAIAWGLGAKVDEAQAGLVAGFFGQPDAEVPVRALMRREGDPVALLREALEVLGTDRVCIDWFDAPHRPAEAQWVEATPDRRSRFSAARSLARTLRPGWLRTASWAVPLTISVQFWIRLLFGFSEDASHPHHLVTFAALGIVTGALGVVELRRSRPRDSGASSRS